MSVPWLRDREYLEITPTQFETRVLDWLRNSHDTLNNFNIIHSKIVHGDSGDYEIDVHIQFSIFGGATITVLVECKRYRNPVKRDVVMLLEAKLRDTSAHKGMVFSTSGFQRGAVTYATKRGIALVDVADGDSNFFARSQGAGRIEPPPWIEVPDYIGWFQKETDDGAVSYDSISDKRYDPLIEWLTGNAS
jgi:restriction system protein